uniref:Uncharacterized protein n=1 Tax=Sciurus vulgaris TaxID=55149 RepID=A0A8D2DLJ2_SCIVU
MWVPSHCQLCLSFLLVCVLSAISFFLYLQQDLFRCGLGLSVLCPDCHLLRAPVAIICLTDKQLTTDTFSSCLQDAEPVSGTWTIHPGGRFASQLGQYMTLLPLAQLISLWPSSCQPRMPPGPWSKSSSCADIQADSRIPWQKWQLQDWLLEKYSAQRTSS